MMNRFPRWTRQDDLALDCPYRVVEMGVFDDADDELVDASQIFMVCDRHGRVRVYYVCHYLFETKAEWCQRMLRAVRAYLRIMRPKWHSANIAEAADAAFDGGEWSTSAHADMMYATETRVDALVARRFGFFGGEVRYAVDVYLHEEEYKEQENLRYRLAA
jgi:hypothetical protein